MDDINEDKTLLTDSEEVRKMLETRGWAIVKAKYDQQILDLQNITNIDTSTPDNLMADLKARKMASDILFNFLKLNVYGTVEQQDASRSLVDTPIDFIERTR